VQERIVFCHILFNWFCSMLLTIVPTKSSSFFCVWKGSRVCACWALPASCSEILILNGWHNRFKGWLTYVAGLRWAQASAQRMMRFGVETEMACFQWILSLTHTYRPQQLWPQWAGLIHLRSSRLRSSSWHSCNTLYHTNWFNIVLGQNHLVNIFFIPIFPLFGA